MSLVCFPLDSMLNKELRMFPEAFLRDAHPFLSLFLSFFYFLFFFPLKLLFWGGGNKFPKRNVFLYVLVAACLNFAPWSYLAGGGTGSIALRVGDNDLLPLSLLAAKGHGFTAGDIGAAAREAKLFSLPLQGLVIPGRVQVSSGEGRSSREVVMFGSELGFCCCSWCFRLSRDPKACADALSSVPGDGQPCRVDEVFASLALSAWDCSGIAAEPWARAGHFQLQQMLGCGTTWDRDGTVSFAMTPGR